MNTEQVEASAEELPKPRKKRAAARSSGPSVRAITADHWYNDRMPTTEDARITGTTGALNVPMEYSGNFPASYSVASILAAVNTAQGTPTAVIKGGVTLTPVDTSEQVVTITVTNDATAPATFACQVGLLSDGGTSIALPGVDVATGDVAADIAAAIRAAWGAAAPPNVAVGGTLATITLTVVSPEVITYTHIS